MIPYNSRRDIPLETAVEPRLKNMYATVETMQPHHSTTRWCTREWSPSPSPNHALVLSYVLSFLGVLDYPAHATSKVHRHARSYRLLQGERINRSYKLVSLPEIKAWIKLPLKYKLHLKLMKRDKMVHIYIIENFLLKKKTYIFYIILSKKFIGYADV